MEILHQDQSHFMGLRMHKIVDGVRVELTAEEVTALEAQRAKNKTESDLVQYKLERRSQYPGLAEQLDMIYWDKKNSTDLWKEAIDKVKSDNPKP